MYTSMNPKVKEYFSKDVKLSGMEIMKLGDKEFSELMERLPEYVEEISRKDMEAGLLRKNFMRVMVFIFLLMAVCHFAGFYFGALTVSVSGAFSLFIMYRNIQKLEKISMKLEAVYKELKEGVEIRVMSKAMDDAIQNNSDVPWWIY